MIYNSFDIKKARAILYGLNCCTTNKYIFFTFTFQANFNAVRSTIRH